MGLRHRLVYTGVCVCANSEWVAIFNLPRQTGFKDQSKRGPSAKVSQTIPIQLSLEVVDMIVSLSAASTFF